ncbi:MAG: hypothetical protein WCO63_03365 [Bacteroidota bacterium]
MKLKLTLLMLAFCGILNAQVPGWGWAKKQSGGGTANDQAYTISIDNNANVYVSGAFSSSTLTFGGTTLSNPASPNQSVFLVKYDPSGNVLWARNFNAMNGSNVNYLCNDAAGNVYVTGYFASSSISFGSISLTNANAPNQDVFIVKYDPLGNVLWAKRAGGNYGDFGLAVACDPQGNVCMSGYFKSPSIVFGTFTLNNYSTPYGNSFLVKYDESGNVLWAKTATNTNSSNSMNYIWVDNVGNIYGKGHFQDTKVTYGSVSVFNTSAPNQDIYLFKFDGSGNVIWGKSAGSADHDYGLSLTVDPAGNSFIGGYFKSNSISFGSFSLSNTSAPSLDLFLVKYNSSGSVMWVKGASGSSNNDVINSIYSDKDGNVYATGYFQSPSITFGSITLLNSGSSNQDLFFVKYNNDGIVQWARSIGGSGNEIGNYVLSDLYGDVFLAGQFSSPSITMGATTLTNSGTGTSDFFIAKLFSNPISTISGKLSYDNSPLNSPLTCSKVYLKTSGGTLVDSADTDQNGDYLFDSVTNGNYILTAKTNMAWGGVNATDAMSIIRHFAGFITLSGLRLKAGDINNNNYLNASDAYYTVLRFNQVKNMFLIPDWLFETPALVVNGPASFTVNISGICAGDVNASFIPPVCGN